MKDYSKIQRVEVPKNEFIEIVKPLISAYQKLFDEYKRLARVKYESRWWSSEATNELKQYVNERLEFIQKEFEKLGIINPWYFLN